MLLSKKWLEEYIKIDVSPREFVLRMTMSGTKAEGWHDTAEGLSKIVAGRIMSISGHPDADKLLVCEVDVGEKSLTVVTGATNLKAGDLVPVVLHGGTVAGGKKIEKGKLRGVMSEGMLCSLSELGLSGADFPSAIEDGIFVIDEELPLGSDIIEGLGLSDIVTDFEVTSNRPDCLSVQGLAREVGATFDLSAEIPAPSCAGSGGDASEYIRVRVKDPGLCPRYYARAVKNVKIGPSPRFIRERLRASGVRPISNIVDITNYVMLELGQPLHAFDRRTISGGEIVVRRAENGEKLTTLDGISRELTGDMLMICDAGKPIGIAGVMGGENSEIVGDTTEVIFEGACFNAVSIRKTATALGLRTESSSRFEKGLSPETARLAVERACELVELLGCGEVVSGAVDVADYDPTPRKITLDHKWINSFLGTDIPREDMVRYLEMLDFSVDGDIITVPHFRGDVEEKADIAEEVARIYGYDRIPTTLMISTTAEGGLSETQKFERNVSDTLRALGANEIYTYTFAGQRLYDRIGMPKDHPGRRGVEIKNPFGEDSSLMRTTSYPSILTALGTNYTRRVESAVLFELARVFIPKGSEDVLPDEPVEVMIGMYGAGDFFALKGMVESLLGSLSVAGVSFSANAEHYFFHPGRCADVTAGGEIIGTLGQVRYDAAGNFGIETECFIASLSLEKLFELSAPNERYSPLPRYPAVTRDIAVICDDSLPVAELEKTIRKTAGELLESVRLFDVYRGAQLPSGKKSAAYSLVLRDGGKTLSDADADAVISAVLSALEADYGARLRA